MSFTKLSYDKGAYTSNLNQSVGPGVYRLGEPQLSCGNQCFPYPPSVRLQRQGDSISNKDLLIDVDSELMGINRKLSQDPSTKYQPKCNGSVCSSGQPCGQGVSGNCSKRKPGERAGDQNLKHWRDCFLPAEDTRLSNPSCNLRGTGWNRWEWLCINPQERVEIPFDYNIQNRIIVKDNHRACIPTPIDPSVALPKGGALPCEPTKLTCAVITQPNSTHWQSSENIRKY
jgi:hypothetical protein